MAVQTHAPGTSKQHEAEASPQFPSLRDFAHARLPLSVPWVRRTIRPGDALHTSELDHSDWPFALTSPFDFRDNQGKWLVYDGKVDGHANFRNSESTSHESTSDHYSGSLGLTLKAVVVKASVTGSYDKTVNRTADSHRISQTSYFSGGSVCLVSEPPLTTEAKVILTSRDQDGPAAFRAKYGDYYVAALRLGGDSGAMVSVNQSDIQTTTRMSLTVSVKVLFFKPITHTERKTEFERVKHLAFTFAGYDTLDGVNDVLSPNQTGEVALRRAQEKCEQYLVKGRELIPRIRKRVEDLGLKAGHALPLDVCGPICQSGLVVSILCMPYETLRSYREAMTQRQQS